MIFQNCNCTRNEIDLRGDIFHFNYFTYSQALYPSLIVACRYSRHRCIAEVIVSLSNKRRLNALHKGLFHHLYGVISQKCRKVSIFRENVGTRPSPKPNAPYPAGIQACCFISTLFHRRPRRRSLPHVEK